MAGRAQLVAHAVEGQRVDQFAVAADGEGVPDPVSQQYRHVTHAEQQFIELFCDFDGQCPQSAHRGGVQFIEPQFAHERCDGERISLLPKRAAAINQPAKRDATECHGHANGEDNGFMRCRLARQIGQHAVLGQAAETKREDGENDQRHRHDPRALVRRVRAAMRAGKHVHTLACHVDRCQQ